MQTKQLVKKVADMCAPFLAEAGLTLWDVTFEKEGKTHVLTVFIDSEKGVFIDDCEKISRAIDPLLDAPEFDSLPSYSLCVSSAGLERALRKPAHFEWAAGRTVDVTLFRPRGGQRAFCGVLLRKTPEGIELELDGRATLFPDAEVSGVRLHFEMD